MNDMKLIDHISNGISVSFLWFYVFFNCILHIITFIPKCTWFLTRRFLAMHLSKFN